MNKTAAKKLPRNPDEMLEQLRELANRGIRLRDLLLILAFCFGLLVFAVFGLITLFGQTNYIDQQKLHQSMTTAIQHQADLRAIRHLYTTAPRTNKDFRALFMDMHGYYSEGTALSIVLEDLRTQHYLSPKPEPQFLARLDQLITEHTQINPFDKLDANQKNAFQNIRLKLNAQYDQVQEELNALADQLHQKNLLVNQYLKDSTVSFWVSVTGLVFSLLVGCLQLLLGRRSKMNRLMADAVGTLLNKRLKREAVQKE